MVVGVVVVVVDGAEVVGVVGEMVVVDAAPATKIK